MTESTEHVPRSTASSVLLAENVNLFRDAVAGLLNREPDLRVVAALECQPGTVLPAARRLRPDVAVVDLDTAPTQGMAIVQHLHSQLPQCQVVALVPTQPPALLPRLLAAGVRGVIGANAPADRLLQAIRAAVRAELVIDHHLTVAALATRPNPLTARERGVLQLVADGEPNPAIARRLHLSAGTVRNYLSKAISKTQARTKIDAVRIANEAGWL